MSDLPPDIVLLQGGEPTRADRVVMLKNQIEAVGYVSASDLAKAQCKAIGLSIAEGKTRHEYLIETIAVNVDNPKLSDSEFRDFVRNSLDA